MNKSHLLENLRLKHQELARELGSLYDYLDRGNPDTDKRAETRKQISDLNRLLPEARNTLLFEMENLRKGEPDILASWISAHIACCDLILAEGENKKDGSYESVRHHCAEEIKTEWENIQRGENKAITINWYFLKDYEDLLKQFLKE